MLQAVEMKRKFLRNELDGCRGCCRMRGLGWGEGLHQMLFNNLNQAIRVGACGVRLKIARLSATQVTLREIIVLFEIAEPSLGFLKNPNQY